MKKVCLLLTVALMFSAAPMVFAQEHVEVGAYADYLNLRHADQGFWGLGGRVGFGVAPHVMLEADMAYDFAQSFSSTNTAGFTTNSNLHLWHGTFGPKVYANFGAFRPFVFAKGGFLNFGGGSGNSVGAFTTQVANFTNGDTNGVFYPGVGFDLHKGAIGFRVEAGDFMYFDRGANHNLRITFGPQFTF
jgi:hypothetical protein